MKLRYFLATSLATISLAHAQDTKEVKINNNLSTALEQVDTDGEYLKLEKSGKLLETISEKVDEFIIPDMVKSGDIPANFSVLKALRLTGMTDITAGSESVKKEGNSYISKLFIQTNGSRKGILSLLGKADQPWASLEYAPANTALLLETELDLTAIPQIMKQLAPMLEKRAATDMLSALNKEEPIAGNTIEQILQQANARISFVVELDATKTWGPQNQKLPVVHATGRIDGIAKFLWENYGKEISENIPVVSKGNIHTILSPEKLPTPWGELTPVFVIDTDKNHIWLSLSEEHLQSCREGKSSIKENKDFQLVNIGNRDQGAARIYLSKQLTGIAVNLLQVNMKNEISEPMMQKALAEVVLYMHSLGSISSCLSHDAKGILIQTNAPFPIQSTQLTNISYFSFLAGASYGPIMKNLEASARTQDISQMKNIYSALLGYMAQNDNLFPNNLQQLVDAEHMGEEYLTMKNRKITYINGLTPNDASKVILYTTPDKNGMAIYVTVDGATRAIHHFDLEELLAAQQK